MKEVVLFPRAAPPLQLHQRVLTQRPAVSATPDMCALSERQELFSVDGKFISSEDGTTPTEFYNAVLLFSPPPDVAYLCSGSALFLYTC